MSLAEQEGFLASPRELYYRETTMLISQDAMKNHWRKNDHR